MMRGVGGRFAYLRFAYLVAYRVAYRSAYRVAYRVAYQVPGRLGRGPMGVGSVGYSYGW